MPVLAKPFAPPAPVTPADFFPAKTVLWTMWDGSVTLNLSDRDAGYMNQPGRAGFGPVDAQVIADTLWDGSTLVRTHRPSPRTLVLPLAVIGSDPDDYRTKLDALWATFRHPPDAVSGLPTPGRISVAQTDGTLRSLPAYYSSGGAPSEDELDDLAWALCFLPNLQFYAPVATWEGAAISQTWVLAGGGGAGVPPMPPVTLTTGSVIGTTAFTNPGDADSYPVWSITGPGTPTITNVDTGDAFQFTSAIGSGVTVTVDCRPPSLAPATGLTAVDNLSNDWWPSLANYPAFWSLPPGTTNLTLTVSGATAATSVNLDLVPRYNGGW